MEEIDLLLDMAQDGMERALKHTQIELSKIRAGKANANMLDGIMIDYYGVMTPITQVSSITTPDARSIQLKPFERKIINDIERAIINSNIGLNPSNDGDTIRLNIPPLTEERRRDLVKKVKAEIEIAKVNVRKVRQETNDDLRKLKNDGVSEDAIKIGEEKVQKITNQFIDKIDQMFSAKEADIMNV
jgi:ribosome recycling factor